MAGLSSFSSPSVARGIGRLGRAACFAVVICALVACKRKPAAGGEASKIKPVASGDVAVEPPVAVRTVIMEPGEVDRPIHGTGTMRLKSEATLSFKIGGVVKEVLVEEGAKVKKGQILAKLDPTEVNAALRQAQAAAARADRDVSSARKLQATGALANAELQNAESGSYAAHAGVSAAAFNAQRAVIVAPDDGRVDRKMLEAGEVVAPGQPVLRVSGRSKGAVVRLALTDRDALRVAEGDTASIILDAKPDPPLAGTVVQIATAATPETGTFDVEVRVDNGSEGILSGLTAKVEIHHQEKVAGILPIGCLVGAKGLDASVFVVDRHVGEDGSKARARKVPVKVAFLLTGRAALASAPVEPKAEIVEAGSSQLEDGSPVRVLP